MASQHPEIKKLAMIGCGAMGGGMGVLFAEKGLDVLLRDPSEAAMDRVIAEGKKVSDQVGQRIKKCEDYAQLCKNMTSPRVFVWSLPHGYVGDSVLDGLMPHLERGDIIIDAANEHWENTERRQFKCFKTGIRYVGMGVSGGYQAARRGPSMCPGTDDETMEIVLPLLRKAAARAPDGTPCVGKIGLGGAGHYCKMIHNGIEHGMMAAITEAFGIMTKGLGMSLDEVGDELHRWNKSGELQGTFLVRIGADICLTKDAKGNHVLDEVGDKVVQDLTGEEGTGIWSNTEAVDQHIPAPTLTTAHYLRLASGELRQRRAVQKAFSGAILPQKLNVNVKKTFLEDLRKAVYATCLASYIQGMNTIHAADKAHHWHINYQSLMKIWRAGCIIQADYISSALLMPFYKSHVTDYTSDVPVNILTNGAIAVELKNNFPALKKVVLAGTEGDHVVPSMGATVEWVKYMGNTDLPTGFYEAQLDYFGRHMYDKKDLTGELFGRPELGKWHYEWKPA